MTSVEALAALSTIEEFDWLTKSGTTMYTTSEIAEHVGISANTVRGWAGDVRGTIDYEGKLGLRFPRSGLLIFFAERIRGRGTQTG